MDILDELSSAVGDRTEAGNRRAIARCLADRVLLDEIVDGLERKDRRLAADCAEVLCKVAAEQPAWVAPYAERLAPLIHHKAGRVRWEAMRAISRVADRVPQLIEVIIPDLRRIAQSNKSVIMRDGAADALSRYACLGPREAGMAYPGLCDALEAFAGKQAHHAMPGLVWVARYLPAHREAIRGAVATFLDDKRGVVRRTARRALREMG